MRDRYRWRRLVPVAALAAMAVCAAPVSGGTAVTVSVTPALSTEDQPVQIAVRGLAPAEPVTVDVSSVDAKGVAWASSATARADRAGSIDAGAPIAAMRATQPDPAGAYFWDGTRALDFTVSVRAQGRELASTTFRRRFSTRPIQLAHQSLASGGFYGEYWAPTVSGRQPAILVIGGSEGGDLGMYLVSALLAAHGYPTLDLAYFDEPGLPQSLSKIPLEYFARALGWLRAQPHVDPNRVIVLGASRGSEAALLLGVHYPALVHGVIASVPSNVALCSYPGCAGPTWTLHGKALPFTSEFDQPHPFDNPAAVIPVERIRGPILLDCAGKDLVWDSCPFAVAIMQRLAAHHDRYRHVLYRAPEAGHAVGGLLPYEPVAAGTDPADELAREKLWPHVLAFLGAIAQARR
jgi:dienelactone hydrolase